MNPLGRRTVQASPESRTAVSETMPDRTITLSGSPPGTAPVDNSTTRRTSAARMSASRPATSG